MERSLQRRARRVLGKTSGFGRVLFRGVLRSISYVQRLGWFMGNRRVGFKDFQWIVERFSVGIIKRVQQIADRAGRPIQFVPSGKANKEALVRKLLVGRPAKVGLICVLSCVGPSKTFTARRAPSGQDEPKDQVGTLPAGRDREELWRPQHSTH